MKKLNRLLLAALLTVLATTSQAIQIDGTIDFTGSISTDSGNLLNATQIIFGNTLVEAGTGTYDSIPNFADDFAITTVTFPTNPLSINPLEAVPFTLWGINTDADADFEYSFDLSSLTVDTQTANYLSLSGSGTLMAEGYVDTFALWSLTTQIADGGTFTKISFSANNVSVPEPGTVALLGLGLLGLSIAGRKNKKV